MISAKVTSMFFDRAAVIEAVGKARVKVLKKAGWLIREDARASLVFRPPVRRPRWSRNRATRLQQIKSYYAAKKASASKPGDVPFVRRNRYPSLKAIIYAYDPTTTAVVVGPIERRQRSSERTVPDVHEHGGRTLIRTRVAQKGKYVKTKKGKTVKQKITKTVAANYPVRPIMGPAFEDVKPQLPGVLANVIGPTS